MEGKGERRVTNNCVFGLRNWVDGITDKVRKTKEKQGEEGRELRVLSWTYKTKISSGFKSDVKPVVGFTNLKFRALVEQKGWKAWYTSELALQPPACFSAFFPLISIIIPIFSLLLPFSFLLCPPFPICILLE